MTTPSATTRPTGAALLRAVADAYLYRFPPGTVGWAEEQRRSMHPVPGDFVVVRMAIAPPEAMMGWLVAVEPGENEYVTRWIVECLDGEVRAWSNVQVRSIPVGNLVALGPGKEAERWQPATQEGPR